jgi:ABC-type spermidine/putrescine transport system permease subunit I
MFFTLLAAYPVAYYLALRAKRWKNFLLFFLTLPFWTNFLILIYAWFFLLERNGIINQLFLKLHLISEPLRLANSMVALFIVMVYCYLPFMIMPLYTILGKIDTRLFDASADLGATRWQTFSRITVPLSFSGIRTGALLVLIPVFGEFAIPALIGGQKYMLAGSMIRYYFFVVRDNARGSAFTVLCALSLTTTVIVVLVALRKGITFLYTRGSRV